MLDSSGEQDMTKQSRSIPGKNKNPLHYIIGVFYNKEKYAATSRITQCTFPNVSQKFLKQTGKFDNGQHQDS